MSNNWNQPLRWTCWFAFSLGQSRVVYEPTRLRANNRRHVDCCVCAMATADGIFVRLDPDYVPYPLAADEKETWIAASCDPDGGGQ